MWETVSVAGVCALQVEFGHRTDGVAPQAEHAAADELQDLDLDNPDERGTDNPNSTQSRPVLF